MAGLFKNKIIREKIERYEIPDFEQKIALVKQWSDAYTNGELQKKTETQCEQAFNQDFFIHILGYSAFPKENYTIQPKDNVDSGGGQMPDATLGYFNKEGKRVVAVVEIKNADTSLDKSQYREGNLSPIQQAFKYKPQYKECGFVIATNFYEIRLFRDNQLDYEKFTLSELVDPKNDYFNFRKFFFLLNVKNFVAEKGQTETELLLSAIRIEQEKITNRFYAQYKELRESLITDIVKNNTDIKRADFYSYIVEKAQKIVDRVVFICFFEDCGLLPENRLTEVVEYAQSGKLSEPIWDTLKKFFKAVDAGSEKLGVPNGYNGELFKPDTDLDDLKISDAICKRFVELSKFDFQEDLSVNILGHIFEQSITDLERLKQYSQGSEVTTDKKDTKRKKDGIFYTPEYIVDYIVKNSLGKYLHEKEEEILQKFNLDDKRTKEAGYNKKLIQAYSEYSQFLRAVRVLDPACGSGAFLVKVFDYLLAEHKRVFRVVHEAEGLGNTTTLLSEESYIKPILENNIYGVDLNPESVEITKLSLWLKSAQKGQKLITLKGNIKCGNSLIDDPKVANERAFNWSTEFSPIMNAGGFDVVVGNPPYIKEYTNKSAFDGLREKDLYQGKMDLWYFFVDLGLKLLKEKGKLSFIAPNNWTSNAGAKNLRDLILKSSKILSMIDFGDIKIFNEAGIQTMIFVLEKQSANIKTYNLEYRKLSSEIKEVSEIEQEMYVTDKINFSPSEFDKSNLYFVSSDLEKIFSKAKKKQTFTLNDDEIAQGIVGAPDECFLLDDKSSFSESESEYIKDFYTSTSQFECGKSDKYIIYLSKKNFGTKKLESYPNLYKHFIQYETELKNAKIKYKTPDKPYYYLHRERDEDFFKKCPKIVSSARTREPAFCYTEDEYYGSRALNYIKTDRIDLKYLTALLNSDLAFFWFQNKGKMLGQLLQLDTQPILSFPINYSADDRHIKILSAITDSIIDIKKQFNKMNDETERILLQELKLKSLPKTYYELSFEDFINTSKTQLDIDKKGKIFSYFEDKTSQLKTLASKIASLKKDIDLNVNEIYEITPDESILIKNNIT